MRRRMFLKRTSIWGLALLACIALAAPASADSIDFSTTSPGAWSGADRTRIDSLSFGTGSSGGPLLTITAWTNMSDSTSVNPLVPGSAGHAGFIFWGKLGDLNDGSDGKNQVGLGVQDRILDSNGTYKEGGSKGISGGGEDQDEALIFTFASPFTKASSIKLTLVGINDGKNSDTLDLYLDFVGPTSKTIVPVSISGILAAPSVLDFSTLGLQEDVSFGSFAVRANTGHFGVGGIEYTPNPAVTGPLTPVPEPGTMLLLGAGLAGLAAYGRKRFRK